MQTKATARPAAEAAGNTGQQKRHGMRGAATGRPAAGQRQAVTSAGPAGAGAAAGKGGGTSAAILAGLSQHFVLVLRGYSQPGDLSHMRLKYKFPYPRLSFFPPCLSGRGAMSVGVDC